METFWLFWTVSNLHLKQLWLFFGQQFGEIGLLLFQHMVTLTWIRTFSFQRQYIAQHWSFTLLLTTNLQTKWFLKVIILLPWVYAMTPVTLQYLVGWLCMRTIRSIRAYCLAFQIFDAAVRVARLNCWLMVKLVGLTLWLDLAKYCHFGKTLSLWLFFEGSFCIGQNLEPNWAIFHCCY